MRDELATILRLVADGTLSADEAAPIIEALSASGRDAPPPAAREAAAAASAPGRSRRVRIQVTERGRRVVDVRVPLKFAAVAAQMIPGIPDSYGALIKEAAAGDTVGTIVDAEDEDGDGVLISVE
jgi:hypothetical protein